MCLPSACSAQDVNIIASMLGQVLGIKPTENSIQNQEQQCHTSDRDSLNAFDIVAMWVP